MVNSRSETLETIANSAATTMIKFNIYESTKSTDFTLAGSLLVKIQQIDAPPKI